MSEELETLDPELKALLANLHLLTENQKNVILADLSRKEQMLEKQIARDTFMGFVNKCWPTFISGRHHKGCLCSIGRCPMSYWIGLAGVMLVAYVLIVWEDKTNNGGKQ